MLSKYGLECSGAKMGAVPNRLMLTAEIPEYPSLPTGQMASPM